MPTKYSISIQWLFQQFPSYQNLGAQAYKPGLENTRNILAHFENPEKDLTFIHVAGTNGKGSTCAFIHSFLQQKGLKVGLFTSPHLVDFRERIRINGKAISETAVIDFIEQVRPLELDLSFFEITLAMALVHFKEQRCDYVVLETGLGGRLDATNVVTPALSIITNIGFDHQAFLGNTLLEIAGEKAGIIKPGVPAICGEENPTLQSVFKQKAEAEGAAIYFSNHKITDEENLLPSYQRKNAALAMEGLSLLGFDVMAFDVIETWKTLFPQTGFMGRLFPSPTLPNVWYDASHNAEGFNTTIASLVQMGITKPLVVFGASNDKSLAHLIESRNKVAYWYFSEFSNTRSYRTPELKDTVASLGFETYEIFQDVNDAILEAINKRSEGQGILVTGSFFLLSDCREIQQLMRHQLAQ